MDDWVKPAAMEWFERGNREVLETLGVTKA